MPREKRYYRPDEVAEILQVHRSTVYRQIKYGQIPAKSVGKSLRIPAKFVNVIDVDINEP